ncbi:hypothetical protein HDU67_006001, partial [Dinochytrium kinnereticum]
SSEKTGVAGRESEVVVTKPAGGPVKSEMTEETREDGTRVTVVVETYDDRVIRTTTTVTIVDGVENESVEIEEEIFETEVIVKPSTTRKATRKVVRKVVNSEGVEEEVEVEEECDEDQEVREVVVKGSAEKTGVAGGDSEVVVTKPAGGPVKSEMTEETREDGTRVTVVVETYDDRVIRTTTTVTIVDGVENESVEIEEEIFETEVIVKPSTTRKATRKVVRKVVNSEGVEEEVE